jgi:hypothetical protein
VTLTPESRVILGKIQDTGLQKLSVSFQHSHMFFLSFLSSFVSLFFLSFLVIATGQESQIHSFKAGRHSRTLL